MENKNDKEQKLRELEKRYKLFYEYAPIPYQSLDENVKIIDVNQSWLDFFGYDKEEVIGECFGEFLILKSRELLNSRFSHFKEVGVIQDVEYEIVKKDGIHRIIWLDGRIEYDKNGNFTQAHCFFKDITERKSIENQLRSSKAFLSNVFTSIQDGISILNKDLNIIQVNPIMELWYSHSMPILGKKCYEVYHERNKPCEICPSLQALRSGQPAYEVVPKRGPKQKITGWLDLYSFPLLDEKDGRIIGVIEYVRDISVRIKAEQRLRDSEIKFKYLFENAQVGLYWSRISDGKFIECNEIFAKLFGYETREELLEKYIATEHYVYPNQRNEILDAIRKNKEVRDSEILVTKRDGTPIWLSLSARMSEKENRIEGAVIDITKRKKAEQELKESEVQYKKAYDKADFYKDLLAHDVSNILNNINASIQLIDLWKEESELPDNRENMIEIVKQQLQRGASLVSNVRKLSEIEEGDRLVKSVDVINVINDSIEDVLSRFQYREIEIKVEKTNEVPNVKGGDLLIDAFENILINGALHNESDVIRIWVKVSEVYKDNEKFAKIEFKDNGIGIIEDRKKAIFERNYKNNRSTGGMGIGLSLVKTIINSYDGQVWVDNRVIGDHTKGSIFVILLKQI
ncbi:MAG: PAS domain S-box protein [Promethearchaeota archaeon]